MKYIGALMLFLMIACQQVNHPKKINQLNSKAVVLNQKAWKLATTYPEKDSIEKAFRLFNRAIQIEPVFFGAYWNKFQVQKMVGKMDAAKQTIREVEHLRPGDPDLKLTAGIFWEQLEDSVQAVKKYEIASQIYTKIMDTMSRSNQVYIKARMNQAINLKLLGKNSKTNEILDQLIKYSTHKKIISKLEGYKRMPRQLLMNSFVP